eukprot:RCo041729
MAHSQPQMQALAPPQRHSAVGDVLTPMRFLERSAAVYGGKRAGIHGALSFTFAELFARVRRLATALAAVGVERGDRVAVLCPNIPPMLEAHFGVPWLGAILVPLNTRITESEVGYIVNFAEAKVFLVDNELAPAVSPIAATLSSVRLFVNICDRSEDRPLPGPSYEEFLATGSPAALPCAVQDEWDTISINFTSGTTGNPKGVMLHHRGAYLNALDEMLQTQINSQSVYLWVLPMFHCNGWCFPWGVVAMGGTQVFSRKVEFEPMFQVVNTHKVTHMCAAPVVCAGIVKHAQDTGQRFGHPVFILIASAPPPVPVFEAMEALGVNLVHCYGLTEVYGPHIINEWQQEWAELCSHDRALKKSRQGVPYIVAHYVEIMDPETMTPVPRDGLTVGEIMMRGNNVMLGYYKDPESTAKAFAGGWFHTGDLGVMHPDNYLEIVDRAKDIVISGGENISTLQVERVLCQHQGVAEVAVVAVPDEKWGEVPKAFVVPKAGVSLEVSELAAFCRARLPGFKVPKAFAVLESVPRTSLGKPNKAALRKEEWKGFSKGVH